MKRFFGFLISLLCLLGFTTSVYAISNSISVYNNNNTYEFIDGLEVNYYRAGSYPVYVLDNDTYYSNYTTLTNPRTVSSGFDYIINNSNPTSNSEKNYYITQVAVLWYEDYLNGNDNNISVSMKNHITNNTSNTICYYINKLVNNAKNYTDSNYISISNNNITFTRSGSYYYSNVIYVTTNNLTGTPTVGVYNAPSSTTIVEKNVYANGNGSFQIRIPVSSLNSFNRDDFEVYVKGYTNNRVTYSYSYNGTDEALYGYNYSSSNTAVEESIPVILDNVSTTGNVRLEVLDANGNNIRNVKYYIYKGDCKNTTCSNSNYVTQFTTNSSYTNFDGILTTGTYTLVRQTNTSYKLNEKELIEVENRQNTQTIYIYENGYSNTNTSVLARNVNIKNSINKYENIIKIYNSSGTFISSYRSNNTSYNISLKNGNYYIIDSNNTIKVYFEVSNDGKLYITNDNKKEEVSYINLDKYVNNYSSNENNNQNTNNNVNDNYYTDENGTIYIDNLENIDSIEISQEVKTETSWISNIIDCPITSVSSTIKYIIGAIILATGIVLTIRNVKKQKNNI